MSEQSLPPAIAGPALLVFAASRRDPRYEAQMDVFQMSAADERSALPGILEVFTDGESRSEGGSISAEEKKALRDAHAVGDEDFLIAIIATDGSVLDSYDAPVKTAIILETLGRSDRAGA